MLFDLRSKKGGRRTVKARDFFKGAFVTDMTEDELLTDILVPGMGKSVAAYYAFDQAASGYALAGCCAVLLRKRATIAELTISYTGLGDIAFVAQGFEAVVGTRGDADGVAAAATAALAALDIPGDVHAPSGYRRHLAVVAAQRAIAQAYERAGA